VTDFERRAALTARIDTLERHAKTLQVTLGLAASREVGELLEQLRLARGALDAALTTTVLTEVEHVVDAASLLLASLDDVK
jgi:hypothetical protein